jgi:hypothetical protein
VSDYQGRIRLTLQGLNQLDQLDDYLASAEQRAEGLRQALAGINKELQGNITRRGKALQNLVNTRQERLSAAQSVINVEQRRGASGRFLPGPNINARRLARARLEAAKIDTQNAQLELGQALQERRYLVQRGLVQRGRRLEKRALPQAISIAESRREKRAKILEAATVNASAAGQQIRLGSIDAQFQRRLQAFRRGGGGTNAPETIEKVFEITQAYAAQKKLISATGDLNVKVTRAQARELGNLSESLGRYNEKQLEANRLARSRVERLSGARRLGDRLRPFEVASGTARDPASGELLFPNVTRPPFPRREVSRARQLVNRAASAAESGDQELFRLASFQAQKILDRLEAGVKAGLKNAPKSALRGAAGLPGSPLFEAQQLQKAIRAGGAKESIKGRKDLVGSPAYYEEQQRQLQRAVRAGGPKESLRGRKDLPGSPAFLEEQRKQQAQQLQRAIRAGGARESISGRKDLVGSPAYYEEQQRRISRLARQGGASSPIRGNALLVGSPAYLEAQQREIAKQARIGGAASPIRGAANIPGSPIALQRAARAGGPADPIKGRPDLVGSPAYYEAVQREMSRAARLGGAAVPVRGRPDLVGSPAYFDAQRKELERVARSRQLASPIRGTATMVGSPAYLEAQARLQTGQTRRLGPASPIRGTATMVGSPAYLAAQQRGAQQQGFFRGGLRQAVGEGLIGGAFPLLFGQGLGASIGGAAGGVSGGLVGGSFGFGLSLIGTALGSAVDTTVQNLKDLAGALKSPTDAMAALEASGFRVGDSLKFQVEQLQAVGRGYDAQTLVLREVERRLGAGSVRELNALNTEQKKLQDQWSAIAGTLQSELLPALVGFTNVINGVIAAATGVGELPVIKQLVSARNAIAKTPLGRVVVPFALAEGQLQQAQQRGRQVAATSAGNRPPLTPQQAFADETTRIQESRRIADQIQSAYREAFKLQRQAYDLQREGADINREIADYSYRKEREIFDLRQQAAEKEIENNRAAAQNRIERGDLSARQTFAAATGFEQQLLTNVRESMRTRKEGEADIEQSRRRLELTMAKLNRDVEDYKRTNAREIEDIERRKLAYTRSVEDYKMQVADYVLQRSREAADLMRQAMTLPDMSGAGGGTGGGTATGYFARLAELESTSGKNWQNPSSNARGFFQLIPKTENWLNSIGKSDLAARMLSRDFNTASQAAKEFAILMRPAAKGLIEAGDVAGLDRLLNKIWTSLPGGAEAATGQRLARANALLTPQAGMATGRYIQGGYGPRGPNQYGAHFDIARTDASYFERNALDRYVRVNGAPLSSGYTVPGPTGGRFGASRDGGTREHRAWDYAFGANAALTLTGGAQWVSNKKGDYGDATAFMTPDGKVYRIIHGKFEGQVSSAAQAVAATQISNIPQPRFNATPLGATPSAAPMNAERMAVLSRMVGSEQEAQRILEEQNKLRQKGVELGQIEQILQGNQLPQLEQQYSTLQMQIEARRQNLELSDDAASVADIQAESTARIAQLEKDRTNALARAQKQFTAPQELQQATKQINEQANLAIGIARKEEEQRRKNLDLNNKLQNQERVRNEILQLQEGFAAEKAQAAALERGELQASNVELLKASTLYKDAEEAQQRKLLALTAETEELRKQNEFRQQIGQLQQERRFTGAGLRAGMIGEPARRFEQALNEGRSIEQANQLAQQARLLEDQQLIWANLEKNIVDVSDAISGALTNGLLDIVSGAREIEDVGRDMLNGIARTFADSAQQQLSTLLQRQIAQFAGPRLAGMIGGGAQQATGAAAGIAGVQALGSASFAASGQVAAFGVALQTVMGQMAFSGVASGLGSAAASGLGSAAASGLGSAFSSAAPNILGSFFGGASPLPSFNFGGFLANGGTTRPGEGYIVGEEEPEFFFPGASGRVVPKSDLEKAAALAEEGAGSEPIDIRYTVTEQAGERYVTEDQFRKGMAATSKRAQAMAYAGMRNNKEVRDYTGIG